MFGIEFAELSVVIGGLVALVNILTQVVKQITKDRIPSSLLAVVLSEVVTLTAFFVWIAVTDVVFVWYYLIGAIIVGALVSYAAMFGYDKLQEILDKFTTIKEAE